jgi:signal transduction histidine kinase/CheY-like chemotaxis protein
MAVLARLRRFIRPLVIACILFPAVVFGGLAWLDYRLETMRARAYVTSTTDALSEHAQTVLETTDLVLARVLDHINGQDWRTLSTSAETHDFLLRLKQELPQVESVFLVDPHGTNVASSREYPFPSIDVSSREYFQAALAGDVLHVSAPFRGIIADTYAFTVSRPRITDGRFDGLVAVTVSPAYFHGFYRLALTSPYQSTALLARTDGTVLVRFPQLRNQPVQLGPDSKLMRVVRSGAATGMTEGPSSIDGRRRITGFRRLAGMPLMVGFGLDDDVYMAAWRTHALLLACLAILLSAGLLTIEQLASVRTAREHAMLRSLVEETERRQKAEAAMTQMQKIEALGRLTGGVAHDFNNLLAAVLGSLELAMKRTTDERVLRLLSTAFRAADRGAKLTAQMLAFSRKHEIAAESVDPNRLIRGINEMLRRSIGPLVRIHYELATDCWPVLVDRVQLEVSLLNLAVNARDAMPLGGDLVLRSQTLTNPAVAGLPSGDFVRIAMTDSGTGMPEDVQRRAFEPFFTTKGPSKGTGLGLSMVYGYIIQIGGTVVLDSAPGRGTTVNLYLPRATEVPQELQPVDVFDAAYRAGAMYRVLLVDDDESVRLSVTAMIEDLGHHVVSAESGARALRVLAEDRAFDAILLDYAMPVMTGVELAAEIMRFWPDAPIAFMTGYVENDALRPWLDRGFRTARKPFTSIELATAIDHAMGARPSRDNVVALRK